MLYYNRTYVSKEIDVDKTSESKEWSICDYWYFLNKVFRFQPNEWNGCYDLLVMSLNLSNAAFLSIRSCDYGYIISGISKSKAINLLQYINLTKKGGTL